MIDEIQLVARTRVEQAFVGRSLWSVAGEGLVGRGVYAIAVRDGLDARDQALFAGLGFFRCSRRLAPISRFRAIRFRFRRSRGSTFRVGLFSRRAIFLSCCGLDVIERHSFFVGRYTEIGILRHRFSFLILDDQLDGIPAAAGQLAGDLRHLVVGQLEPVLGDNHVQLLARLGELRLAVSGPGGLLGIQGLAGPARVDDVGAALQLLVDQVVDGRID